MLQNDDRIIAHHPINRARSIGKLSALGSEIERARFDNSPRSIQKLTAVDLDTDEERLGNRCASFRKVAAKEDYSIPRGYRSYRGYSNYRDYRDHREDRSYRGLSVPCMLRRQAYNDAALGSGGACGRCDLSRLRGREVYLALPYGMCLTTDEKYVSTAGKLSRIDFKDIAE